MREVPAQVNKNHFADRGGRKKKITNSSRSGSKQEFRIARGKLGGNGSIPVF